MCCEILRYGTNHIGDWVTAGFFILAACLMVFLYFYTIAICVEQINCSFTGQRPKLSSSYDWSDAERPSVFWWGIFGLSLLLLLPASTISTKVACGMFILMFLSGLLGMATTPSRDEV
jgi:hypothetical protein